MRVNLRFCLVDQRLKVGNGICKGDKFRMKRWSFVGGGGVITRCFGLCNELIAYLDRRKEIVKFINSVD